MGTEKRDIAQDVTDRIINLMEAGTAPWRADWTATGGTAEIPLRSCGLRYRGINILMLWMAQIERGFTSPHWFTFKQAKDLGGMVRKGEKGSPVVKVGTFTPKDASTFVDMSTGQTKERQATYLKGYTVFNACQIDGLPERYTVKPQEPVDTGARPITQAEEWIDATGAKIIRDGSQPRYIPATDTIHMPPVTAFETADGHYATMLHELTHWTGHAKRLDRLKGRDREAYALEELIAEIGACIACAAIGIKPDFEQSASYVESWLKALRNDKKYIFRAASKAQAAFDLIEECQTRRTAPMPELAIAAE